MSSAQCPMISVQPVVTRVIEGMVQGGALAFSEQYQPGPGCVRALEGARLECSVVAWSDTMPLTYQWLKDGVPVQGAVGADQWIAVDAGDGGRTLALTVCVSNAAGPDSALCGLARWQPARGQGRGHARGPGHLGGRARAQGVEAALRRDRTAAARPCGTCSSGGA